MNIDWKTKKTVGKKFCHLALAAALVSSLIGWPFATFFLSLCANIDNTLRTS